MSSASCTDRRIAVRRYGEMRGRMHYASIDPMSASFSYAFNEGQLLDDPDTAYEAGGDHPRNLSAVLDIEERGTGTASVTVTLEDTLDGEAYSVHAHDMADPAETPNGTPYNETLDGDVFAQVITGTGGAASASFEAEMMYAELVETCEAFLVVHDRTQAVTIVDLTTYLVLGIFGQSPEASDPNPGEVIITLGNDGASAYFASSVAGPMSKMSLRLTKTTRP